MCNSGEPFGREGLVGRPVGPLLVPSRLQGTGSEPGRLAMPADILGYKAGEELQASSGQMPGILLNYAQARTPGQRMVQPPKCQ